MSCSYNIKLFILPRITGIVRMTFLTLFLFNIFIRSSFSQYNFTNFDHRDGLYYKHIKKIRQDSLGYIWLGCSEGLVKYDGQNFEYFTSLDEDSSTISSNDILSITCMDEKTILISTHEGGLNKLNTRTNKAKRFYYYPKESDSIGIMPFFKIYIDKNQKIWLGSQNRGLSYLKNGMKDIVFPVCNPLKWHVRDIIPCPNTDSIYVSAGFELYVCDINTGCCNVIEETISDQLIWNRILLDSKGIVWSARYSDGLTSFNPKTKSVQHYIQPNSVNSNIIIDDHDRIWLGTKGLGLKIFDTNSKTWEIVLPKNNKSIPSKFIESIYKDHAGGIWLGTSEGISYLNPDNQNITGISITEPGSDINFYIHDYYEESDSFNILVNAYFDKVIYKDNSDSIYKTFDLNDRTKHFRSPHLIEQKGNDIYIFFKNGIAKVNKKTKSLSKLELGRYSKEIEKDGYFSVAHTEQDKLIFTKPPNLLFYLNLFNNVIDSFHIGSSNSKTEFSRGLFYQDMSNVWIEKNAKLLCYNLVSRKLNNSIGSEINAYLKNGINEIIVDKKGTIWVATWSNGLFRFGLKNNKLYLSKKYTTRDGLINNRINSLVITPNGSVFASSASGLSLFLPNINRFSNFTKENGLLDNNIIGMRYIDDKLVLFHELGYSKLNTKNCYKYRKPTKPIIKSITSGDSLTHINGNKIKNKLYFQYEKNDISIEFTTINFSNPNRIKYQYKLEGIHDWKKPAVKVKVANYPNLNPGNYTFLVKSKNESQIWSSPVRLSFSIVPPFWRTWWFIIFSSSLLLAILYIFHSWNTKRLKLKEHLKSEYEKQLACLELKALRSQMNPHFMFNSLNSIKNYILKHEPILAAEYLSNFSHLIRLILQYSRERQISLKEEIDMIKLYVDLEKLRFKDKFITDYRIDKSIDLTKVNIPPMILQPHIENAIWHGLLHKEKDRKLTIRFFLQNNFVICEIEDNGIGRIKAKEIKSKSFLKYKSMGLGITKERISLLNSTSILGIKTEIIDKYNDKNQPLGTLIKISMPYENPNN